MKSIDRLYEYFDLKGMKPTALEKKLGISNGYLGTQKRRSADMGESMINKIVDYCRDLSLDWLLTGRGEMLRSEQVEQLQNPTIIYKSDPKDAEIIAAKDLIIKRDAELIAMLQCRIRSLEEIKTFRVQDLDIARSADTTTITGTKSIHK